MLACFILLTLVPFQIYSWNLANSCIYKDPMGYQSIIFSIFVLVVQLTPDYLPVVDRVPTDPNIMFAAGLSGIIAMQTLTLAVQWQLSLSFVLIIVLFEPQNTMNWTSRQTSTWYLIATCDYTISDILNLLTLRVFSQFVLSCSLICRNRIQACSSFWKGAYWTSPWQNTVIWYLTSQNGQV